MTEMEEMGTGPITSVKPDPSVRCTLKKGLTDKEREKMEGSNQTVSVGFDLDQDGQTDVVLSGTFKGKAGWIVAAIMGVLWLVRELGVV